MRVQDSTIRLSLKQRPQNFRVNYAGGEAVEPKSSPIQVDATCTVLDDGKGMPNGVNPRAAPWKLGFMQARILEINWAYYRGQRDSDGCLLNDGAAHQAVGICRDYDSTLSHVWYEGSKYPKDCYGVPDPAARPPWPVSFSFGDEPEHDVKSHVLNPTTSKRNYLDEGRVSMAFVTTVTELAGPNRFVHHRHFFWSVIWHFKATGGPAAQGRGPFTLLPGSGFWISDFKRGTPAEPRYRTVLDDPKLTTSCNDVAQSAPPAQEAAGNWRRFARMDKKDQMF